MIAGIKLVHGVGINDADYKVYVTAKIDGKQINTWTCPFYRAWVSMLARCYSKAIQARQPSYRECFVVSEWHRFSVFRKWMASQNWMGMALDKDIAYPGNHIYSPDKCVFVSQSLNNFLIGCSRRRTDKILGTTWDLASQKFLAQCNNPFTGKNDRLGKFDCENAAHEAWRRRKHQHACAYADMQADPRIAHALRTRYLADRELS